MRQEGNRFPLWGLRWSRGFFLAAPALHMLYGFAHKKPTDTMPANAKKPKQIKKLTPKLKPADVLTYLQANPGFFEKHKEALASLSVPKKGGNILSLHALKADKLVKQAESLKTRQMQLISTAHANAVVAETVFAAAIALVRCRTLPALRKYLQTGLTEHLELSAIRLFTVGEESATALPAETIHALCPQPLTLMPLDAGQHRQLFGPKTNNLKSVCLMALTQPDGTYLGLLAMGSSQAERFHAGQATEFAEFLRQITSTVLQHAGNQ